MLHHFFLLFFIKYSSSQHSLPFPLQASQVTISIINIVCVNMDAVMNQMNVFLRIFSTVNRMFCEVRWLERNLRNSNPTVMVIVGGIMMFCLYTASIDGSGEQSVLPPGFNQAMKEWGPFAIIILIGGLFLYRRHVNGEMEGSGNLNEVMFGGDNGRENSRGGANAGYSQRREATRQPPPPPLSYRQDNNDLETGHTYPIATPTSYSDSAKVVHAEAVHFV